MINLKKQFVIHPIYINTSITEQNLMALYCNNNRDQEEKSLLFKCFVQHHWSKTSRADHCWLEEKNLSVKLSDYPLQVLPHYMYNIGFIIY